MKEGNFTQRSELPNFFELYKKKLLIAGFGRIGKEVAKRCLGFDMEVYVYDPFLNNDLIKKSGCIPIEKNNGLALADFVSIHLPLNEDTKNFISQTELDLMKKKTILVTVDINSNFEIKLKDLNSRFKSFTSSKIENPEDDLLKAIIMKYFSNAQVQVDKNVIEYLLKRVDRDYQNLYNILEKINILSLQRKSKITTHLIRDIMT